MRAVAGLVLLPSFEHSLNACVSSSLRTRTSTCETASTGQLFYRAPELSQARTSIHLTARRRHTRVLSSVHVQTRLPCFPLAHCYLCNLPSPLRASSSYIPLLRQHPVCPTAPSFYLFLCIKPCLVTPHIQLAELFRHSCFPRELAHLSVEWEMEKQKKTLSPLCHQDI